MATFQILRLSLSAIARVERTGDVRPPRLTEPGHEKWLRIRRRLGWRDFIELLHQDLAEAFPYPFDLSRYDRSPRAGLTEDNARELVAEAMAVDTSDTQTYLRNAAKMLDLPAGGAISDLPKVQPHFRVLELPGAAGRIAAHQVLHYEGLTFHDQFTFVVGSDEELLLLGLAAVELRANRPRVYRPGVMASLPPADRRFDRVFGLKEHQPAHDLAATLKLEGEVTWA